MSDDVPRPLKGFTPDGSGLDRDALLFEAGPGVGAVAGPRLAASPACWR